jgi:ABC-type transport system substrate-binding protein
MSSEIVSRSESSGSSGSLARSESPGIRKIYVPRRQFIKLSAAALGGTLLSGSILAACSDTGEEPTQARTGDTAREQATMAIPNPVTTLEPPLIDSNILSGVVFHVMETLVAVDGEGQLVPSLAESWEVSEDRKTWHFQLREGVKFHDGSAWNADVAIVNLERYRNRVEEFPRAARYSFITKLEAQDELVLRVVTETPIAAFLNHFTYFASMFHSAEALETFGNEVALKGVGTGPYKVTNFVPGERLEVERFSDYWGTEPPIDELVFTTVPDDSSRVAMVETGEAHVITNVAHQLVATVEDNPELAVDRTESVRMAFIGINSQHANLTDVRVRQAFNHAVDKQAIVDSVLGGEGVVVRSVIPPVIAGYEAQQPYEYDPAKAEQLLTEAGWTRTNDGPLEKDGETLTMELKTTDGQFLGDRATCEAVQQYLSAVGVDVSLRVMDPTTYGAELAEESAIKNATLNYYAVGSSVLDPVAIELFEGSWVNVNTVYTRYRNPEFDALYQEIVTTVDDEEARAAATQEAQRIVWADAPWIFLFSLNLIVGRDADLIDLQVRPHEFVGLSRASFTA